VKEQRETISEIMASDDEAKLEAGSLVLVILQVPRLFVFLIKFIYSTIFL
jgi:hypothetical protein